MLIRSQVPTTTEPQGDVFRDLDDARLFMAEFVPYFKGCSQVLDVACGWGLFLDHLKNAGIACCGIDYHSQAVKHCRSLGHDVIPAEALEFLSGSANQWDGIMLSHIIEHFSESDGLSLLRSAWNRLLPGGVLVVLTPNFANPHVRQRTFWLDPTHVRPFSAVEIADELTSYGASIRLAADSQVERDRYHRRKQASLLRAWGSLAYYWLKGGLSRNFLLGDVLVVAHKP